MTTVQEERGTEELKALAEQAGRDLEDASALEILTWAAETFGKRFCVTSSMEDAVVATSPPGRCPGWTWCSSTPATTSPRPSAPGTPWTP
ncbi:hypothetical protein SALBM217S_10516 [Streptomyces griseoloalbus]